MKTFSPEYHAYLRSDAWQRKRKAVLRRAGYRCERCGADVPLDIHHLTYARFGHENLEDLQALCRMCHWWADLIRRMRAGVARWLQRIAR
jgi:5-methylcytosine-specific restriction endonuclease McrA